MQKIPKRASLKKIDSQKYTYSNLELISHDDYEYLFQSDAHPYKNKHRLHERITKNILPSFYLIQKIFLEIPYTYQKKILDSPQLIDLLSIILAHKQVLEKTDKNLSPEEMLSFVQYLNLFNLGLEGLIKTMPPQFKAYLINELKPLILLMQSIANFDHTTKSKKKTPFIKMPPSFIEIQ